MKLPLHNTVQHDSADSVAVTQLLNKSGKVSQRREDDLEEIHNKFRPTHIHLLATSERVDTHGVYKEMPLLK